MSDFADRKDAYGKKPAEIELATKFLNEFRDADGTSYYKNQLQEIIDLKRNALEVRLDDIQQYDERWSRKIAINTKRYCSLFSVAAFNLLPSESEGTHDRQSVYDMWVRLRRRNLDAESDHGEMSDTFRDMATRFDVNFIPLSTIKAYPLRSVRADSVGKLISVRGIVTRVTDVLPLVAVQAYYCKTCGHETYQQVNGREYTPLSECQSPRCRNNHSKGDLSRLDRGSKFRSFQEVKIQELPTEVPVGHIPRSMTVRLYGESLVRRLKPGDVAQIAGIFLPSATSMTFGRGRSNGGLITDTYLEASQIQIAKKNYGSMVLDVHQMAELEKLSQQPNVLERLARSISPEIFGHLHIKKALVLSMVGGVTKKMSDGMSIRGDINILLVGDPGMAKSQLLKHVTKVAPRAVYTTGKGSSGVGLTAAVIRDPVSGEMTLEGGALVLADMGICCIDEFDKMEESDRTAIHEVMEQQTVSIAKAGITTTLNARTTVLAAANPAYGRYSLNRSPSENLAMPAALLSRFDLLFVMLDRPDIAEDERLAHHVTYVHKHASAPASRAEDAPFSSNVLRAYISMARQLDPVLSDEASRLISLHYVETRQATAAQDTRYRSDMRDMREEVNDRGRFVTARMLLSTVRLCQAIARIHLSPIVTEDHARVAVELMHATQAQLDEDATKEADRNAARKRDPISSVYSAITRMRDNDEGDTLSYALVRDNILRMGYDEATLEKTIDTYASAGVWSLGRNKKTLHFTMEAR